MLSTRVVSMRTDILDRYRENGIRFDKLPYLKPGFVLYHDSIIDYVTGRNAKVKYGSRKETKEWRSLIKLIKLLGSPRNPNSEEYVLGFLYPDTFLISSSLPSIGTIPKFVGIRKKDVVYTINSSDMPDFRVFYIKRVLKTVSSSVIVVEHMPFF